MGLLETPLPLLLPLLLPPLFLLLLLLLEMHGPAVL